MLFKNKSALTFLSNTQLFVSVLFFTLFYSSHSFSAKKKNTDFIETEIITPYPLTHPVLAVNLLDNEGQELVTYSIDNANQRWLMVYALNKNKSYAEAYRTKLPKDFHSFDMSSVQGNQLQALYFLSSSEIFVLNQAQIKAKASFKSIQTIASIAMGTKKQYLTRGNFLTQLNSDNYDDIYIADFNSADVLIQTAKGFITSTLPIAAETLFTPEVMRYFQVPAYFEDVNFDGLRDVIYISNGKFIYFLQQSNSIINPIPYQLPINKLINNIDWWSQLGIDGEKLDQSNLSYRKIEQLRDINNDNIIDMVVQFTQSEGVLTKTNDYEVYLGRKNGNTLEFLDQPDSAIHAEGTLTDIQFIDINDDNKDEVLVAGFDIGLSQIISALLSGSIDQDVHLFYMDENSQFNKNNKVTKEVELSFSLSSGSRGNPVATLLDINGDKRQDLVLSDDDDTLKIYLGTTNKRLFERKAIKYKTQLPKQGDMLTSADINQDGKSDILIKYGREDKSDLRNKFKILMSQ